MWNWGATKTGRTGCSPTLRSHGPSFHWSAPGCCSRPAWSLPLPGRWRHGTAIPARRLRNQEHGTAKVCRRPASPSNGLARPVHELENLTQWSRSRSPPTPDRTGAACLATTSRKGRRPAALLRIAYRPLPISRTRGPAGQYCILALWSDSRIILRGALTVGVEVLRLRYAIAPNRPGTPYLPGHVAR